MRGSGQAASVSSSFVEGFHKPRLQSTGCVTSASLTQLKGKLFVWAHCFSPRLLGFMHSPWQWGHMEGESCHLTHGRQDAERNNTKVQIPRTLPRNLPPLGPTSKCQYPLMMSSHDESS